MKIFKCIKYFVGLVTGRKYAVKDHSEVYTKLFTATLPSETNKLVEICDWNPKHKIQTIDGHVTKKFSTEAGDYEVVYMKGLPGFHVWRVGSKLCIMRTIDYVTTGEATIIVRYTKV